MLFLQFILDAIHSGSTRTTCLIVLPRSSVSNTVNYFKGPLNAFLVIMATNNKPYSCTIGMEPIIDLIKHTRTFIFLNCCDMPINTRADGQVLLNVKISSFSGRHHKHLKSGSEWSKFGRSKEKNLKGETDGSVGHSNAHSFTMAQLPMQNEKERQVVKVCHGQHLTADSCTKFNTFVIKGPQGDVL